MRILGGHDPCPRGALCRGLARGDHHVQSADGVGYVLREP
jgi:hypothetical protein